MTQISGILILKILKVSALGDLLTKKTQMIFGDGKKLVDKEKIQRMLTF